MTDSSVASLPGLALRRALDAGARHVPTPDRLAPYARASTTERLRRAEAVLRETRRLYKARQGTLLECLVASGNGEMQGWWARQMVQAALYELDVGRWELAPTTRRADVYRVLDACLARCRRLHGGWRVSLASVEPTDDGGEEFERLRRGMPRRGWKPRVIGGEG